MKQFGERKRYFKVTERTYKSDDLNWVNWIQLNTIGGKYSSEESAKRAVRKFKKDGNPLKKYTIDEVFYNQKATVIWRKDGKRHPKQVIIDPEVGAYYLKDHKFMCNVLSYIRKVYGGEPLELYWGDICTAPKSTSRLHEKIMMARYEG